MITAYFLISTISSIEIYPNQTIKASNSLFASPCLLYRDRKFLPLIIYGDIAGNITAFDILSEQIVWSSVIPESLRFPLICIEPTASVKSNIIATTRAGRIYILDPETGKILNTIFSNENIIYPPKIFLDRGHDSYLMLVFTESPGVELFLVNVDESIKKLFSYNLTSEISFFKYLKKRRLILIGDSSGRVSCYNITAKKKLWEKNLLYNVIFGNAYISAHGGYFYIATSNNTLWVFREDGKLQFKRDIHQKIESAVPYVFNNRYYLILSLRKGIIYCFDGIDGEIIWKRRFKTRFETDPLILYNKDNRPELMIASDDGDIYILDALTGLTVSTSSSMLSIRASIVRGLINNDTLIDAALASVDSNIYLFYLNRYRIENQKDITDSKTNIYIVNFTELKISEIVETLRGVFPLYQGNKHEESKKNRMTPIKTLYNKTSYGQKGVSENRSDSQNISANTLDAHKPLGYKNCYTDYECGENEFCDSMTHLCLKKPVISEALIVENVIVVVIEAIIGILIVFTAIILIVLVPIIKESSLNILSYSERLEIIRKIIGNKSILTRVIPSLLNKEEKKLLKQLVINEIDNSVKRRKRMRRKTMKKYPEIPSESLLGKESYKESVIFSHEESRLRKHLELIEQSITRISAKSSSGEKNYMADKVATRRYPEKYTDSLEKIGGSERNIEDKILRAEQEIIQRKLKEIEERAQIREKERELFNKLLQIRGSNGVFSEYIPWLISLDNLFEKASEFFYIEENIAVKDRELSYYIISDEVLHLTKIIEIFDEEKQIIMGLYAGRGIADNRRIAINYMIDSSYFRFILAGNMRNEILTIGKKLKNIMSRC